MRDDALCREMQFLERKFHTAADKVHELISRQRALPSSAVAEGQELIKADSDSSEDDEHDKYFQQIAIPQKSSPASKQLQQTQTELTAQEKFRQETPFGALPSSAQFLQQLERQVAEGELQEHSDTSPQNDPFASSSNKPPSPRKQSPAKQKPKTLADLRKNIPKPVIQEEDDGRDPFADDKFAEEIIELSSSDEFEPTAIQNQQNLSSFALAEARAMKLEPIDKDPFGSEYDDSQMPTGSFEASVEDDEDQEMESAEMVLMASGKKRPIVDLDSSDEST